MKRFNESILAEATTRNIIESRFPKGHLPWNTGTKGLTVRNKTSFTKGNKPKNHTTVGSIVIRKRHNRTNPPIVWIKTAEPNKWEMLKRVNWAKNFGPIPAGMCVTHRDNNTLNCEPDNLVLITRAEMARRNHNHEKAAETMKKVWALKRQQSVNHLTK